MSPTFLVTLGVVAVALILVLIIKAKVHPFLALLFVSIALALTARVPISEVVPLLKDGMGGTLGGVALIVTLGAMLGRIVEVSGGADVLARALEKNFGEKRAPWALGVASFIFGIPVFVDVATIVLVPIAIAVARRMSGKVNMLAFALPVVSALLAVHVVLPPHPGIVGASELMQADVGLVLLIGFIPVIVMWFVGQVLSGYVAGKVFSPVPVLGTQAAGTAVSEENDTEREQAPSVGLVLAAIILPLALIMGGTVSKLVLPEGNSIRDFLGFIGDSPIALFIGVIFAIATLGIARGWGKEKIEDVVASALPATAAVILITGAGGMFAKVLTETGVADAVADLLVSTGLPVLVLAWMLAAFLRAAQGSATVAALTTAPLVAPMTASLELNSLQIALLTVTVGIGSMAFSHVNDSLFWVWSRYFQVDTASALKSYTVTTTIMSVTGFAVAGVLWGILGAFA